MNQFERARICWPPFRPLYSLMMYGVHPMPMARPNCRTVRLLKSTVRH